MIHSLIILLSFLFPLFYIIINLNINLRFNCLKKTGFLRFKSLIISNLMISLNIYNFYKFNNVIIINVLIKLKRLK